MKKLRKELKKIEEEIRSHEEIAANFEEIIRSTPYVAKLPPAIEAFSPRNLYGMTLALIAGLKLKRIDILQKLDTKEKLQYSLDMALKVEDYKLSAELRDKLKTLDEEE